MANEDELINSNKTPPFILSARFMLAIIFFFGVAVQYMHKTDISVGIVCMVNHTALNPNRSDHFTPHTDEDERECLFQPNKNDTSDRDGPFVWSKSIQEQILSSYFYGYLISQIPGGWLSYKLGPKLVFLISMLLGSIGTVLVPICARWNYIALFVCRFLTGLAQGVMWPTMMGTWSKWAPPNERSSLLGVSNAGAQIGMIVGFSFGGYLCSNGFDGGWPSIFYIFGGVGFIWCFIWYFLMENCPSEHRYISIIEREYILNETRHQRIMRQKMPWKEILSSTPCIALFVSQFTCAWGLILFMTNLPIYLREILKFDVESNGVMSSIPSVLVIFFVLTSSFVSDKLIKAEVLPRHRVRQIFNALGFFIPSAAMIAISFVTCRDPYVGVALMSLGFAFTGCAKGGGYFITYTDIAASYSGILYGISNTIASFSGIIVPPFIAAMTPNQKQSEWMVVFWVTGALYFIGAISSIFFTTSEVQEWARASEQTEYEEIQ